MLDMAEQPGSVLFRIVYRRSEALYINGVLLSNRGESKAAENVRASICTVKVEN